MPNEFWSEPGVVAPVDDEGAPGSVPVVPVTGVVISTS
jgi:hypothetical protein